MASAFESIATSSPSSGTDVVTFSNLQSTTAYDHFLLSCYFSPTVTPTSANVNLRLNGDTANNYNFIRTMVDNSGNTSVSANPSTEWMDIGDVGDSHCAVLVWIIGARSGEYKNIYSQGAVQSGGSRNKFNFCQWRNTNNITSISFIMGDSRLMTGDCRFALYGIKGA